MHPFQRLKGRPRPDGGPGRSGSRTASMANGEWHAHGPTDLLFPKWPRELFNAILGEEKLRTDRDGRPRTAYRLRHTYIFSPPACGLAVCDSAQFRVRAVIPENALPAASAGMVTRHV